MPTWLIFLLLLSVLVLVHELGHFLAARILGIGVEEFAFGLPFTKPLVKIKFHNTQYAIYPVLFGGFVRLSGEESATLSENKGGKESFWYRGKKQRLAVLLAGVFMNILLALVAFTILYWKVGIPVRQMDKVTLVQIIEGSPADNIGLAVGDRITEIEGKKVNDVDEFVAIVKSWAGTGVNLTVQKGGGTPLFEGIVEGYVEQTVVNLVPRSNPPEGEGALGIVLAVYPYWETEFCPLTTPSCLVKSMTQGIKTTGMWVGRVAEGLRDIGKSLIKGKAPEGVAGPVGIYQLTGIIAAEGWLPLLELVAVLSVNLGVFNILPIPALDGGRVAFVLAEWIFKRRIRPETEQKVNSWGMAALIGLMILVSLQDVIRLFFK
jgi:regulator of sigma E protease